VAELLEPEDLAFVRTGDRHPFDFWYRDDRTARFCGNEPDEHWWEATDGITDPMAWEQIAKMPNPQRVQLDPIPQRPS
jgi:hypothetical protein